MQYSFKEILKAAKSFKLNHTIRFNVLTKKKQGLFERWTQNEVENLQKPKHQEPSRQKSGFLLTLSVQSLRIHINL